MVINLRLLSLKFFLCNSTLSINAIQQFLYTFSLEKSIENGILLIYALYVSTICLLYEPSVCGHVICTDIYFSMIFVKYLFFL